MQTEEYARMRSLEDHYWWFVSRRRLALRLAERFAPEAERTLDVGCGSGAVLAELSERGSAVGLDLSPLALKFSAERGLHHLVRGDAERLPFRSEVFDRVVSLDTVEHVLGDQRALCEIARVLRPRGVVVLNVPAFRWLWGPHDVALMHQRRYTRAGVRELLTRAGFRIELLSFSVFFLFPIVVLVRILERRRRGPARVSLPAVPRWLNSLLVGLMALEARLLSRVPLPWGSSIVAVARKL